jgi:hypothetical protein
MVGMGWELAIQDPVGWMEEVVKGGSGSIVKGVCNVNDAAKS